MHLRCVGLCGPLVWLERTCLLLRTAPQPLRAADLAAQSDWAREGSVRVDCTKKKGGVNESRSSTLIKH